MAGAARRGAAPAANKTSASTRPQRSRPSINRTQTIAAASSLYGRLRPALTSSPATRDRGQAATTTTTTTTTTAAAGAAAARTPQRKARDSELAPDEETNIRVVVRCRGRNEREVRENSAVVVSTEAVRGKSVELSMGANALANKAYHFDHVFSPAADQHMVYDDVVRPLLDEMLAGFNCTIFAYGQTGTGKTYTMSGDMSDALGLVSDSAGIIPRVLDSLFRKLEADGAESSVKCSFIELYNEELRDLLAAEENAKLKIYEDGSKKGHGATMVQGVEESHIKSAAEGVRLLGQGSHRRQVAATKCNDLSSRSHTVFTITVYVKRPTDGGEDFVSAGKLNLVDLAGSENIQRSGAENKRAAEAGLINKSLLTLGRVINALVDKGSHIPYRESKLTRLLQDSLGGRTKTCIIATISPAKSNLEETISTLDYAFRAKNIRNKPQLNQMISKKTVLREYTDEIQKLKSELIATRQRNGVYLSAEAFEQLTGENESRRILSEEQRTKLEIMDNNLRNKVHELFSLTNSFSGLKKEHDIVRAELNDSRGQLEKTEAQLTTTKTLLGEQTALVEAYSETEHALTDVGGQLLSTVDEAVSDVDGLRRKLRRKSEVVWRNRDWWERSRFQLIDVTMTAEARLRDFEGRQDQMMLDFGAKVDDFCRDELERVGVAQKAVLDRIGAFETMHGELTGQSERSKESMNAVLEEIKVLREEVKQRVGDGLQGLSAAAARISAEVINELGTFHTQLNDSFTGLAAEFQTVFETLVQETKAQKNEIDALRQELDRATTAAQQASSDASDRLQRVLDEERQQASKDRAQLLSQISVLIEASGQAQDQRMSSRIGDIQDDVSASQTEFDAARARYEKGMDRWAQKQDVLCDEMAEGREAMKISLKRSWADAEARHSSIKATTKVIHQETVQIVDAQMKDVATQMQALDGFVSRARSHNEQHHEARQAVMKDIGRSVTDSYQSVGQEHVDTFRRIKDYCTTLEEHSSALSDHLDTLPGGVRKPLSELRNTIGSTKLQEDVPTGETPPRRTYLYPLDLPQTDTDAVLRGSLKRSGSPLWSPRSDSEASDEVASTQSLIEGDRSGFGSSVGAGLREVNLNVGAGPTSRCPSNESTVSLPAVLEEVMPPAKRRRRGEPTKPAKRATRARIRAAGTENKLSTGSKGLFQ